MKLWICRDKSGDVILFQEKPMLLDKTFCSMQGGTGMKLRQTNNNRSFLKHVSFEDSPQEVELKMLKE